MTRTLKKIIYASFIGFILMSLNACKTLSLTPTDSPETTPIVVECTAEKAGDFTIELSIDPDGTFTLPIGQLIPVMNRPYRLVGTFTPDDIGHSREGQIKCYHSVDGPGTFVQQNFIIRDARAPEFLNFSGPATADVGATFTMTVDIIERSDPGAGFPTGFDVVHVNKTGPITGPDRIEKDGVDPGQPDGTRGPMDFLDSIDFTCTDEGDVTIRLLAVDAAQNQTFSDIHNMACIRP